MNKLATKLFDFLSSVKLAVPTILTLASLLAVGTFYESLYDTKTAQLLIYKSFWMTVIIFLLIINLTCSALDRFPWKKHHYGFVATHIGIIILLIGSYVTQKRGVDASMALPLGEASRYLLIDSPEIVVFESLPNEAYKRVLRFDAEYVAREVLPIDQTYAAGKRSFEVLDFHPYVERFSQFFPVDDKNLKPAVEFTLKNQMVNVENWLSLTTGAQNSINLGPAVVKMTEEKPTKIDTSLNQLILFPENEGLGFLVVTARTKEIKRGFIVAGGNLQTGWMGLEFSVRRYLKHALIEGQYKDLDHEIKNRTTKAIRVKIGDELRWLELNVPQQVALEDGSSYYLQYGFKRIDLGFEVALNNFEIGRYGGTNDPSSYQSTVTVEKTNGPHVISMNEPLTHKDFTFYQASYEQDDEGKPSASILSVNYDPGRKIKYTGAIMIVAGILSMFYFKPRYSRKVTSP